MAKALGRTGLVMLEEPKAKVVGGLLKKMVRGAWPFFKTLTQGWVDNFLKRF